MGSIYFHSPNAQTRVGDRHYMGHIVDQLWLASLDWDYYSFRNLEDHPLRVLTPPGHYTLKSHGAEWCHMFGIAMRADFEHLFLDIAGIKYECWHLALNTAMATGNDVVILCARLHAQCELHGWVDGPNRAWLAGIIELGLEQGILRSGPWIDYAPDKPVEGPGMWQRLVTFLRSNDKEPVVTSYSVCDQFPNPGLVSSMDVWQPPEKDGEPEWDAWYNLAHVERWELGMQALRLDPSREFRPDNWRNYTFGPTDMNGWKLMTWLKNRKTT